jgi:hypothetical protein
MSGKKDRFAGGRQQRRIHDSVVDHFCPFTMALSLVNYFFWNLEVRLFC